MTTTPPPAPADAAVETTPPPVTAPVEEKPAKINGKKQNSPTPLPKADVGTLERLARQLEYYFSVQNLSRDTYVKTLRSLNEGFVPATIIANFGKIKAILSFLPGVDPIEACLEAATSHSTLLQVAHVDKETNKKVSQEEAKATDDVRRQSRYIACIGLPEGQDPIALTPNTTKRLAPLVSPAVIPSPSVHPNRQTLILRDVPSTASQDEITSLFDSATVVSVYEDVSNTWFVILEGSRDDVMSILLGLRSKSFSTGEAIKARLKTATTIPATAILPPVFDPTASAGNKGSNAGSSRTPPQQQPRRNGAKQNQRSNNNSNRSAGQRNGNSSGNGGEKPKASSSTSPSNSSSNQTSTRRKQANGSNNNNKQQKPKTPPAKKLIATQPPKLSEESHFPTLASPKNMTPQETVVVDTNDRVIKSPSMEKTANGGPYSDTSSTATASSTTSSQAIMDSQPAPPPIGGYAAALLRTSSVPSPVQETKEIVKIENGKHGAVVSSEVSTTSTRETSDTNSVASASTSISTSGASGAKPTWGGGASFAEILKQSNATPATSS